MKVIFNTLLALFAFAGNSVLCRLALEDQAIDAGSFTSIRLISGIIVLAIILYFTQKISPDTSLKNKKSTGSWKSAIALFIYALTFSYAYISLETGAGALILFSAVQITIIAGSLLKGIRLMRLEWSGLFIAFLGFIYLIFPDLSTPSLFGLVLMTISGIAWGIYTLNGKTSNNALKDTSYNFFRTLPFIIILSIFILPSISLTLEGIVLAVLSGGIASGLGYAIWYSALKEISSIQASVVQLLVPVIAAIGGVVFIDEAFTYRLAIASVCILGGILLVTLSKTIVAKKTN